MKKIFGIILFISAPCFGCPNMNGHWIYQVPPLVYSDLKIAQPDCGSASLRMVQTILGQTQHMYFDGSIDGVKRQQIPSTPNEVDLASAKFVGDKAVIVVDRHFNNGTTTHTEIDGVLLNPQQLRLSESDLDDQGNPTFTRSGTFVKQPGQ